MQTYEELLGRMQDKFRELTGCEADDASDVGIRLKVLAGELCSLLAEVDWLKVQSFPQTATGESLEQRAQERGMTRGAAGVATGEITFSLPAKLWTKVTIPMGSVCATAGENSLRFVTTQEAVIPVGQLSVIVPARAEATGRAGNAAAGRVCVLISGPGGVNAVTNARPFTGGSDIESDDQLRARLLASLRGRPNGGNAAFYRDAAMAHPGVTSVGVKCRPKGVAGAVALYLAGRGAPAPQAVADEVRAELSAAREIGVALTVEPVKTVSVDVAAKLVLLPGKTFTSAKAVCERAIFDFFGGLCAGQGFYTSALLATLMNGGQAAAMRFDASITQDVSPAVDTLVVCGSVAFTQEEAI